MSVSPVLASNTHGNLDEQIAQLMQCKQLAEQESPVASIGLYVDCGSIYETPLSFGATHLLERMSFKTIRNRSQLRMVREIEAIGGSAKASASREQMGYTYDALKLYTPQMVELKKLKTELGELSSNPQGLLLEAVHSAGYSGALANPLIAPESAISHLNGTILEGFVSENYTAPRIVLAASQVWNTRNWYHWLNHFYLIFQKCHVHKSQNLSMLEESIDVNLICRNRALIALAFEIPGGGHQEKEAMAATVLQELIGGGGSFSAGGPGKGMHSRLCQLFNLFKAHKDPRQNPITYSCKRLRKTSYFFSIVVVITVLFCPILKPIIIFECS
ncbi:hypothetical protein ZIOFF_001652 [Zingiber officinale]|uniref:Peptidase M16 N-terminal domain-containing protein n=1 Tax=Zingiber officinale TaxID=94328 RepID=A0A8J5LSA3_ZINOF|nr:hypothetical protein ZIOFF_001652 [Zingiber officinale]